MKQEDWDRYPDMKKWGLERKARERNLNERID